MPIEPKTPESKTWGDASPNGLLAERDHGKLVRVQQELAQAKALLANVVRYEQGKPHGHMVPGLWDSDNAPGVRNRPCAKCASFLNARRFLNLGDTPLPEGPSVEPEGPGSSG